MRNLFTIVGLGTALSLACGTKTSLKEGFAPTASMTVARDMHTATLLRDGMVLVAGGQALASAELFDPGAAIFTPTATMATARSSTQRRCCLAGWCSSPVAGAVVSAILRAQSCSTQGVRPSPLPEP